MEEAARLETAFESDLRDLSSNIQNLTRKGYIQQRVQLKWLTHSLEYISTMFSLQSDFLKLQLALGIS